MSNITGTAYLCFYKSGSGGKFFGIGLENIFRGVKYGFLGADIAFLVGFEIGFLSKSFRDI